MKGTPAILRTPNLLMADYPGIVSTQAKALEPSLILSLLCKCPHLASDPNKVPNKYM